MAKLVQRRPIRRVDADAKGPGGTILPLLSSLSAVGAVSILAAIAYGGWKLLPLLTGESDLRLDDIPWMPILGIAAAMATLLLPAAVEVGFPRVAWRNRWLLRGAALLAIGQVLVIATQAANGWLLDQMTRGDNADFETAIAQVNTFAGVMGLARSAVEITGWIWLSRGFRVAGVRFSVEMLATIAVGAAIVQGVPYGLGLLSALGSGDLGPAIPVALELANLALGLVASGLGFGVLVQLLAGSRQGLLPRGAWRAAGLYGVMGVAALAATVWAVVVPPVVEGGSDGTADMLRIAGRAVLDYGGSIVLPVAFALGLGRGTASRLTDGPRVARYWVTGERRLHEAGA